MGTEIEVPPFFVCPISLQIMRDPVTISTGITYDRDNIERWIFSGEKNSCPVTKLPLTDTDLTPNHTLRRLIQSWCTLNASHGVELIPTPKPPVDKSRISRLISQASNSPHMQLTCLAELRRIASESASNRRILESSGAVDFIAALVLSRSGSSSDCYEEEVEPKKSIDEEALSVLYQLKISESNLKNVVTRENGAFIEALTRILQRRNNYESQAFALDLMNSTLHVADPPELISMKAELFIELVQVLRDQISSKATKTVLKMLIHLCSSGRNRVKAVEAGGVGTVIDLLLDCSDKRICEMMLVVLDQLCGCAEGRADLLKHGAGMAVVSKKILRISHLGSEMAVRILHNVSKYSATAIVVQEMVHLGVVAKLSLLLRIDCEVNTKEKARKIIKMHARAWSNSPCAPKYLIASSILSPPLLGSLIRICGN
ncbi:hypothetical protein Ancab_015192 [Ancistrocladus abbreviatus]